jgi:hypothetical protein
MRTGLAVIAFGLVCSTFSVVALADSTTGTATVQQAQAAAQVTLVGGGNEGRLDGTERLRYPGFEQTTVVHNKGRIVMITMQATQVQGEGPVQCSCTAYDLKADGPPKQVVPLTKLTHLGQGERTCNHPKAIADEAGNIVWMYGSDSNSNRVNTYAGIINDKCEQLAAPQMVNISRNANDGAPDIVYNGKDASGASIFTAGYYSDGGGTPTPGFPGEGGRYSVGMGLKVTGAGPSATLTRTWIEQVISPTDIGRPTIAAASLTRSMFCAPEGPNRPSNNVACALVDSTAPATPTTPATTPSTAARNVWRNSVALGDDKTRTYFNQPTIAKLSNNRFALMTAETNAMGKNGNVKGSNLSHMFMLEQNGDNVTVNSAQIKGAAVHQTHPTICTGGYSDNAAPAVAVFSAAPTGIGRAAMQLVKYDDKAKAFNADTTNDMWPTAWYGDSGHLSNWYGRNPGNQGRDFLRCIGGVPNPGHGVPNGYQSNVKTFFVGAVHGRVPGDAKNSLFLSLVPGESDVKLSPQNPVPAGESVDTTPVATDPTPSSDSGNSGGCAMTSGSTSSNTGTGLALFGLALGAALVRSRRSKKS